MKLLLQFFASLRLTVVLLSLSIVLIFFGTLDQVRYGIFHTQELYFESFIVYSPFASLLDLMVTRTWNADLEWLVIPLPGGYTLGLLLFFNLTAAHATRFQLSWRKSGIFLTHLGLLALLIGELLTDLYARESRMWLHEDGAPVSFSESYRDNEIALIDTTSETHNRVYAIPESILRSGRSYDDARLPFIVDVVFYYPNAQIVRAREGESPPANPATQGAGATMGIFAVPRDPVFDEEEVNTATAYVRLRSRTGENLGTWLVSNVIDDRFPPQRFQHDGRTYEIWMRYARTYYPFSLRLEDFSHDRYPGTNIPRNFSSLVEIDHPDAGVRRTNLIYMNHPLRYEGHTFYQASFANQDTSSMLQVVENPGWLIPYFGVGLVWVGLTVQFGIGLFRGMGRRRKNSTEGVEG